MSNVKKSIAERTRHKRLYDRRVNKRQMQKQESKVDLGKALDVGLVVTESSGTEFRKHDTSSRSRNDADADNAAEPMAEYTEKCQVKSLMLDSSLDNKTTEFSNQSLVSKNICLKKTVAQFQIDFSRMGAHCIALELKYQNQSVKSGQHGQILKEKSNEAKIKHDIDEIETINIELEHSVAKLLAENKHLNKEKEHLKQTYNDLYYSIKKTRFPKPSVFGKPVLQTLRNQSGLRQPTAFKSKRPKIPKQRFASQVDVKRDLSKPDTQHYFPKIKEYAFAKPDHVIASNESRNSSKNMPRFSSNDMVHNHYLEEARKKTQERDINSKSSVMPSTSLQNTSNC
ncbi:hypothetical protein Tco_1164094 [Tanacetum coccineum]